MKRSTSRDSSNRHANVSMRGLLSQADDTQLMQLLQFTGYSGEVMQLIEHAQPYGFDAFPLPPGSSGGGSNGAGSSGSSGSSGGGSGGIGGLLGVAAEHFTTMVNSGRSHGVTMHVPDRRFRLFKKVAGEIGMYDDQTHQSHITRAGHVRSSPNDKHHRHQVMKQGDKVIGSTGFGQTPWAYDTENGNKVRNSHSYRHHDANLTVKQHPTEHSKHIITGDAIPPDGQGKSNIKHKVQLHAKNGHVLGVFGQNDSNYRHSTIHDDQNGITSSTQLSRALTATKSISHSAGTTHSVSAQQSITQTAGTTHTVSGQQVVHNGAFTNNGTSNLNGNTTIEQDLNVSQNIQTASLGLTSDKRLKSKRRSFDKALKLALKVPVCRYNQYHGKMRKGKVRRKGKAVKTFGVIAQELRSILPELVNGNAKKEILTIQETKIGVLALAALQEFVLETRRENAELKLQIAALEDVIAEMK